MTQTPNTPAGWYPQGGVERWWDGNAWTEHTRPMQPTVPQPTMQQPTMQQPAQPQAQAPYGAAQVGQPGYATPQPGQPGYYQVAPVKESHTTRNVLIILAVLFLLFVGGCVAVVAIAGRAVDNAVNDDTLGGPNNPMEIEPGEGFDVSGFEYADGWGVDGSSGVMTVTNLKVTNNRDEADRAIVEIKLLLDSEVVATSSCNNGADTIPAGITVTLDCSSSDQMPADYDTVTINDLF